MEKTKKNKIVIISVIVALVLIVGVVLTILLTSNNNDRELKKLLANVSEQISKSYDDLVQSYNDDSTATQTVNNDYKQNLNLKVLASTDTELERENLWISIEGSATFQDYIDNINNVMAHYAIAEYLVENANGIKFGKTYYFKSSTVEYYAVANYNKSNFTFTIQNETEKIRVQVNIADGGKLGESIEFFKEAKTDDGKHCYQYSTLNFKSNKYKEILLTSKNKYAGELNNQWIDNNIEQHHEHEMNHGDRNSYVGKKYTRNDNNANYHNDPASQKMNDTITEHKDKLFDKFEDEKSDNEGVLDFPNPEKLQSYAFNKYLAKLSVDANGKTYLQIVKVYEWVDKNELIKSFTFDATTKTVKWEYKKNVTVVNQKVNGQLISADAREIEVYKVVDVGLIIECKKGSKYYTAHCTTSISNISPDTMFETFEQNLDTIKWEFKSGFSVLTQTINGNLIDNDIRSINCQDYAITQNLNMVIICKRDNNYYYQSFSAWYSGGGSSTPDVDFDVNVDISNNTNNFKTLYVFVRNNDVAKQKTTISVDKSTLIGWGYNILQDGDRDKTELEVKKTQVLTGAQENYKIRIDVKFTSEQESAFFVDKGLFEIVVYYTNADVVCCDTYCFEVL